MRVGLAVLSLFAACVAWGHGHRVIYAAEATTDVLARFLAIAIPTGLIAFVVPPALFFWRRARGRRRLAREAQLQRDTWARQRADAGVRARAHRENLPRPKRRRNGRRRHRR
ncbi:hypothetical protein J2X52_000729 [Luteimonas sp. 3794]|nr:hypothetical protein [Luteimonas sp. 3794]